MLSLAMCVSAACSGGAADKPEKRPAATARAASGAAAATPATTTTTIARNPCELITKQEVEDALGAPVAEPKRRGSACDFLPQGKRLSSVSYTVRWTGGREALQHANRADALVASFGDKSVQDAMRKMRERAAADLDGVGDEASFQLVTLYVRKGDAYVTIDARLCSRAQAIAVARKVVSRL